MMHDAPASLVGDWGPFAMFGGGYRVAVPLYGSIMQRVAGIDLYTFSAMMMVGVPVLTGLVLGAFSYRRHRDPLLFLIVMLATVAMFMTTPYVGLSGQHHRALPALLPARVLRTRAHLVGCAHRRLPHRDGRPRTCTRPRAWSSACR